MKHFGNWLAAGVVLALSSLASAQTFKIDPVHSQIIFKVRHMNVSNVYGRINDPTGTMILGDDPSKWSFEVSASIDNVDTHNPKRDAHLKSPDFFSAKEFPEVSFKSTAVKKIDDKNVEVTGDLMMHGVTKSVTVKAEHVGTATKMGQTRTGFDGALTIKRSDFGMNAMLDLVGDEITLMINLEGIQQ